MRIRFSGKVIMNHSAIGIFLLGVFVNGIVLKESSCKKAVLKKFIKVTERTRGSKEQLATFIFCKLEQFAMERTPMQVFYFEFCKLCQSTYPLENLWTNATLRKSRGTHSQIFFKIGVLKNWQYSHEITYVGVSFW